MGAAYNYVRGASINERFWSKVARRQDDECWEWQASLDTGGYGNFGILRNDGTGRYLLQRAHRVAWMLTHGEALGRHQYLCHTCDNRKCVNPSHLFVGDAKANIQDCVRKGRLNDRSGSRNPRAKLTEDQVRHIRSSSISLSALSRQHGVVKSAIAAVKNSETWKDVL